MLFFLQEQWPLTNAYCELIILFDIINMYLFLLQFGSLKFRFNVHLTEAFIQFIYSEFVKLKILVLFFEYAFFAHRTALIVLIFPARDIQLSKFFLLFRTLIKKLNLLKP